MNAVDYAYQRQLELLQEARRSVADITTMRKRAQADGARDEESRRCLERIQVTEERATLASMRLQAEVDRFRTRKETIKAAFMVAQARQDILAALADHPEFGKETADMAADEPVTAPDELEKVLAEVAAFERWFGSGFDNMSELRLEAADLRLLFSVESADSVILLVVGMGQDDWQDWYDQALSLAWQEQLLDDEEFEDFDEAAFLARYFPGEEDQVRAAARKLVERSSAYRLANLRERAGLTVEQVAERMRVAGEQVEAIEEAGSGVRLGELEGYIEALGGRLDVTARVGTESITFG